MDGITFIFFISIFQAFRNNIAVLFKREKMY